jgi:tripeptide aminopeptidase
MPGLLDRFLRYVRIGTTASEESGTTPSTAGQLELLRLLEQEARDLGMEEVHLSPWGVLYARVPGKVRGTPVGMIAHVDTSPEAPGAGVSPVLHDRWDGGPIELSGGITIDPADCRDMHRYRGATIVTSDGSTLLGVDDKAGVAIIMDICERLISDRTIAHPPVSIAFTPDEEIGRGVDNFEVARMGAHYAYTVDGGAVGEVETQTFNACAADWVIRGRQVHPGSARGIMVNSIRAANDVLSMLRPEEMPENSSGMEGYDYPMHIEGNAAETRLKMLLRDFTIEGIERRRDRLRAIQSAVQLGHPGSEVRLEFRDQYRNPGEILSLDRRLVEYALEGTRRAGLDTVEGAIRGGTDGSRLSYMGLPCVNMPTGGELFHSRAEWVADRGLELSRDSLVYTLGVWAEQG